MLVRLIVCIMTPLRVCPGYDDNTLPNYTLPKKLSLHGEKTLLKVMPRLTRPTCSRDALHSAGTRKVAR